MGVFESESQTTETNERPVEWKDWIPEDERVSENAFLNNYDNGAAARKAHGHAVRKLSQSITPPGEDAAPEDVTKFWRKLGAPEEPKDYTFNFPEGTEKLFDEQLIGTIKEVAHSVHVPAETLDKFMQGLGHAQLARNEELQTQMKETLESYQSQEKKLFGEDLGKVDERIKEFVKTSPLVDDVLRGAISSNPLLNSHPLIKAGLNELAKRANTSAEVLESDTVKRSSTRTRDVIEAEIQRLMDDPFWRDGTDRKKVERFKQLNEELTELG